MREALREAAEALASSGIADAPLEAEVLLRHALDIDRARLYYRLEEELSPEGQISFYDLVKRRLRRESLWYIIGHREFFGLDFLVDHRVLVPRPETELLVQKALELINQRSWETLPILADVGTGSGAIAISLAVHLPQAKIYAIDISAEALHVAALNRQRHHVENTVHLLQGDILAPLPEPADFILADLPYLNEPDLLALTGGVLFSEPWVALSGGLDGLEKIRQLLTEAGLKLRPRGMILLEIGYKQGTAVTKLASLYFPQARIELTKDLAGLDRMVSIET